MNQRKSYRCAIPDLHQQVELLVGDAWLPAEWINESAGGFAVKVCGRPDLSAGDKSQLRTAKGHYEVRVAWIGPLWPDPPEMGDAVQTVPAEAGHPSTWFQLGLERLGEIEEFSYERMAGRPLWHSLAHMFPGGSAMLASVLAVGIIVAIAAGLMGIQRYCGDTAAGKWVASTVSSGVKWALAGDRDSAKPSGAGQPRSGNTGPVGHAPSPTDGRPWAVSPAGLGQILENVPGAAAFIAPEVDRALQLTRIQRERIQQIVAMTAQALRGLGTEQASPDSELGRKRARILSAARREALDTLTSEQRAQWDRLTQGLSQAR